MPFPRVTARRLSHVAVVLAVTIGLLPMGPAASAITTGALQLNGTTQYVSMGASPGLRSAQFTVELWFKRTGAGVGTGTGNGGIASAIPLITKGRAEAETAAADVNYFFGIDATTGQLVADFEEAQGNVATQSSNHPVTGTTVVTSNVWHHAAATYDGTTWRLYLDGNLDQTLVANSTPNTAGTSPTVLGSSLLSTGATPAGFFQGQIDEARIWSTARSQSQIQATMNTEIGPTNGLLGLWHMNEGTGTSTADTSGVASPNPGTLVAAPTWTTGNPFFTAITTGALQLNGTTQYVSMGASPGLRSAQFTVELWFKRTGAGVGTGTGNGGIASAIPLITKGRAEAETAAADVNYFFGIDATTGQLVADFEEAQGNVATQSSNHPVTGTTVVTSNVWHHAAATYDGTTWRLYLDGNLDQTLVANSTPNTAGTSPTVLGSSLLSTGATPAGFFQGQIDEARIWSTARSQSQIQATMNTEIGPTNGLLGLWHMNEGTGTSTADTSGVASPNPGTLVAAPTWTTGNPFFTTSGLLLSGSNQYVTMGASPGLRSSTFTVELWFRRTAAGVGTSTGTGGVNAIPLITKGRAEAETAGADVNYFFGIDTATGKLAADFEEAQTGSSPSLNHPIIGNTVVTSNVWHHAAATYDGTTWRLYLDGAADGSLVVGQPVNAAVTSATAIGSALTSTGVADGFFAGQIDEARIWSTARSLNQIQSTMNSEVSSAAGLVGSWHMNDGSGTVVADSSGGGINGSTVASPTWTYGMLLGAAPTNQAPVVDSVSIDHASPQTNDTLSAAVTSHDADGDPLTTQYQWTKNGTDIPGATNPTLNLATVGNGDRGDLMRVRVTVSDASLSSTPLTSAPVTILNTAPSATVALDDHTPGTNATLNATATSADLDGDVVTLTYVWKVNGATRQTTTTSSLTDTFDLSQSGNGNNGQNVSVTVTPNDGTVDGGPVVDSATVGNAAPVVDSVSIDQALPRTNDTLTATVTSHDADGDALTTGYQWVRNGNDISGETGATLDLSAAGNGDRGDLIRVRVTVSDGTATSAPVTSAPVAVADTAPIATVSLDDHSPSTNAVLTANATTSDGDGDGVALTYVWRVDGVVQQTTPDGGPSDSFDLSLAGHGNNGQNVSVTVTPNDGTVDGPPVGDSATVGDAAPVVDSVVIDQAAPQTNDTLSATVSSHDVDGDTVATSYQWTKNGVDLVGETGATLDLSTVGYGDRGDLIRVRVTVSDGMTSSAPATSSSVIVANTSPTATVALDDPSPATSAILTATATAADVDGDNTSLTYVWKVDGTTRRTTDTSSLTDTFDLSLAGNGDNGQTVTVTVTPSDGAGDGSPVTDTATVGNAAPVVDSVTIDQASPRTNEVLSTTVTSHDPDGDALTTSYQWTMNGGDIAGATTSTLDLSLAGMGDRGDLIRVRVIVADASLSSSPMTSSPVTIANTSPAAMVGLSDHSPNTSATLTANATVNDADGDGVTLTYVWRVDGTTRRTTTGAALSDTFDLSIAGNGDNGQTVTVTVTPNDGTDDGVLVADSASVGNGTPVVDSIVIDQASPRTNDTLTASVTSHDPDGDPLTTTYQWTKNGVDISGATGGTLDLSVAGNGNKGDLIRVRATVADGAATSAPLTSASVAVVNTAPTASVSLNDHSPDTNATLTATATASDVDSDTVTLTYVWRVDGVTRKTTVSTGLTDTFGLSAVGNGNNGQTVTVTVTPTDGTLDGAPVADSATIGNSVPVVDSVVINQSSPRTNDTLSAAVSSHDADGDPLITSYQWTRNGSDIGGANGATLNLSAVDSGDRGDLIRVRVTVADASTTSAAVTSAPVTVLNTVPVATVALNDHAPAAGDTLTATATRADADGDTVGLTYVWTVNGTTKMTTVTNLPTDTFDLSVAGNGDAGDVVVVTVTPNDGTANGAPVSDSGTVATGTATPPIFSDDFTSGNFLNWTAFTRMTIDNATGSPTAPSARAQASAQSAFAYRDLTSPTSTACLSVNVNLVSGSNVDLFRLRSVGNGPIVKVFVATNGTLQIRSDFASTSFNSGVQMGTGFHNIELCGTVGTTSTWNLYRDGVRIVTDWATNSGTSPVARIQIGDTAAKTFTANFDHVVLDLVAGEGAPPPDTQGPTTPGQPAGTSPTSGAIQLAWTASTDASPPITYRIYRDGNATSIGSTTATTYTDPGLTPGSSHTYTVDALDSLSNPSLMSPVSASILVSGGATPPIFSDDFTSGNFLNWTAFTRMTIDNATGSPTAPSARAQASAQSAFAYRDLTSPTSTACLSVNVNLVSGSNVDLFRLRSVGNGPIVKVFVATNGTLQIRSDFASTSFNSGVQMGTGFHNIELCGTVGTTSTWNLYRDGVRIVTDWATNSGTSPVARIQIGDTAAKTFTANFDHVVLDLVAGEGAPPPDTQGPTTPGQPAGTSPTSGAIQLAWTASTDASPPITYRIYRDGNATSIGSTTATTYTDPGLTPGSSHTYTVDALDSLSNPSLMSPVSASILVSGGATPPIFSDDFTSGNFLNWTAFTRMTIDNATGSPTAPSARAQASAQSAFAYRDLTSPTSTACLSVNVNLVSGSNVDLFRLRSVGNGPIVKVFVATNGTLQIRSDFASTSFNSGVQMGTGFHNIELCGTVGTTSTWNLYRDGVRIVTDWATNSGTSPVARIQIGDTAAKTFTANFDHVVLDLVAGD